MPTAKAASAGRVGASSELIPRPNDAGVVLISRHLGRCEGLQLIFHPDRMVSEREVRSWREIHFPVNVGPHEVLVLRWDTQCCTRRTSYRRRTSLLHAGILRTCTHVELYQPKLLNHAEARYAETIEFTARSWEEFHTLAGLEFFV